METDVNTTTINLSSPELINREFYFSDSKWDIYQDGSRSSRVYIIRYFSILLNKMINIFTFRPLFANGQGFVNSNGIHIDLWMKFDSSGNLSCRFSDTNVIADSKKYMDEKNKLVISITKRMKELNDIYNCNIDRENLNAKTLGELEKI